MLSKTPLCGSIRYTAEDDDGKLMLCSVPADITSRMQNTVWSKQIPLLLTSGTLAIGSSFRRFQDECGLADNQRVMESIAVSPFDYASNCRLFFPRYSVHLSSERYYDEIAAEILRLLCAANGHALVLFTSYADLSAVNERLATAKVPIFSLRRNHPQINKLTSLDIQQFYKDLLENGRIREDTKAKKPGLSSTTVHGIHVMLKSALKRAVQERLIPFNPAEFCIPPKITKPELQVIPSERYQSYLTAAEQRGVLPMFYLELATGLRKGEIAALLWSDFDAQTKTIHVTKQYLFYNGQGTVSPPKSDSSIRYVSISDEAARLLQQEHEKHPNNPYMFPSPVTGEMYHPDAIVKIHRKICKDIGLEHVRFHDLRHSFATTALQCGVDVKTVSTMLGHSSAGFTLNVYTHSTSRMQQEAARTVGKVMPKMLER